MSKQPSSKEVYDRIRWDPGLDGRWFTIGIEDRELGIQELPFSAYIEGGDIPFHRIQYFRCGDEVIWDRRSHVSVFQDAWRRLKADLAAGRLPDKKTLASIEPTDDAALPASHRAPTA